TGAHAPSARACIADFNDLDAFRPDEREHFLLDVTARVRGRRGVLQPVFRVTVCSASWLAQQPLPHDFGVGTEITVLDRWDDASVERVIDDQCEKAEVERRKVTLAPTRKGHWEFVARDA
ncbi:MAG: Immunity protein 8, partial [Solirubrobacteraceae bacterium]|nr:Immunity protein 8 [Solirubrobacteraceae bacterium]